MSSAIKSLEPAALWQYFADINAVPRASKKEEKIRQFILHFGQSQGLETLSDEVGNILIRKKATTGMESRIPVVLQSHLDMVHQKNADTIFDFDTQGIDMYVDDGWVKARGTTLGADNGIGVAAILAILASQDIPHPPLEALFTIDEETGMTGALGLKGGWLNGKILLNLDTEEDDELDIGCAGGMDVTATLNYKTESGDESHFQGFLISISGLSGGHSGIDIHLGRGNANKFMARLLFDKLNQFGMRLVSIDGGSLRNAIPRECNAVVCVPQSQKEGFLSSINQLISDITGEYQSLEPGLSIQVIETKTNATFVDTASQEKISLAMHGAHNGVFRMSPDIPGLVEASNNVARVEVKDEKATIMCLTRSSVESTKLEVANSLKSVFQLAEFSVTFSGDYPGWTPKVHSPLLQLAKETYVELHNHEPKVVACHAGLECGILGKNYPGMDMISFGPTIQGAHSPDERVNIQSVGKFWQYLQEILRKIPA